MPRLHPAVTNQYLEADEQETAKHKPRRIKSTGPAKQAVDPAVIVPADRMPNKAQADALLMNEEYVEVVVHETTDKTANQLPDIYVNGIPQRFVRGQAQKVKWKFIEQMARCRETTYTQQKYLDDNGTETYRMIPHTALKYPFALVNASQKFHDRLKAMMAEV